MASILHGRDLHFHGFPFCTVKGRVLLVLPSSCHCIRDHFLLSVIACQLFLFEGQRTLYSLPIIE